MSSPLHDDFNKINEILARLVGAVKEDLAQIWWLLRVFNKYLGSVEDAIINFSMERARDQAWAVAQQMSQLSGDAREAAIRDLDADVAQLGRVIRHPGFFPSAIIKMAAPKALERARVEAVDVCSAARVTAVENGSWSSAIGRSPLRESLRPPALSPEPLPRPRAHPRERRNVEDRRDRGPRSGARALDRIAYCAHDAIGFLSVGVVNDRALAFLRTPLAVVPVAEQRDGGAPTAIARCMGPESGTMAALPSRKLT